MAAEWHSLRSWNGSQEKAFEEVCCQLATGDPYSSGSVPDSNVDWLRATADLPAVEPMLMVRAPDDGSEWYVLNTHYEWRQPARPGRDSFEEPRRHLWLTIRSGFVRRRDAGEFFHWAKRQDFFSERMPEPQDMHYVFLGESFWASAFRDNFRETPLGGWTMTLTKRSRPASSDDYSEKLEIPRRFQC
jgi:hypothetical protein